MQAVYGLVKPHAAVARIDPRYIAFSQWQNKTRSQDHCFSRCTAMGLTTIIHRLC